MNTKELPLKELLYVEKQFQNAVNLQLDYNRREKVDKYIPTRASAVVLREYLQAAVEDATNRASMLIGPYGKGKSHLLLVLIALLCGEKTGDDPVLQKLVEKIRSTDEETGRLIDQVWEKKLWFLPVIVTNTSYDLNQAFLVALREALHQAGLEQIELPSNYEAARNTIEGWKQDYPQTYAAFLQAVEEDGTDAAEFMADLSCGNRRAYHRFVSLYPKLTSGGVFNPLLASEIHQIYMQVNDVLCEEHGYSGLLVLFDEFSKFIEGHPEDTIASDMKILQDMCELAASSKEKQMHMILVAHKSIKEYGRQLSKQVQNAYRGVEGRLTERLFVTSSQNNYELIQHAIGKYPAYQTFLDNEKQLFDWIEEDCGKVAGLQSLFSPELFRKILVEGCYPLLPITAVLLLKISEQAAQNERTLFTFIAREEPFSLAEFIACEKAGQVVTADRLYDYFSPMFKQNKSLEQVHYIWLAAEYALSCTGAEAEQRLLKAMALLHMIGQQEEFPANRLSLEAALHLSKEETEDLLESLVEQGIIRLQRRTSTYMFCRNTGGVNIEEEIKVREEQEAGRLEICPFLNEQTGMRYLLPKSYNQRNCITRYYRYVFMKEQAVLKLPSAALLFEEYKADGILLCIVSENEADTKALLRQMNKWQEGRVVLLCPKKPFAAGALLLRLKAILSLQGDKHFTESNQVLTGELKLLEEDCRYELMQYIREQYIPGENGTNVFWGSGINIEVSDQLQFQRALSENLEEYYTYLPIVNHELINRRIISAPIRKARQKIMERLLSGGDCSAFQTGTSPESTIYRAVLMRTGIVLGQMDLVCQRVFGEIQKFFDTCVGQKQPLSRLFSLLQEPPYGIREGVIPIYLAWALSRLESMPCIYQKSREVPLNGATMQLLSEHTEEYFLYIEEASARKAAYIRRLQKLFAWEKKEESGEKQLQSIAAGMQEWYQSLPQYTRTYLPEDNTERNRLTAIRRLLRAGEINPRELLLEQLPKALGSAEPGEEVSHILEELKKELDDFLPAIKKQAASETHRLLNGGEEEDFFQVLQMWRMEQNTGYILSKEAKAFTDCIDRLSTHDQETIINLLSKALLDLYIENWKDGSLEEYLLRLGQVLAEFTDRREEQDEGASTIILSDNHGIRVEKQYVTEEDSTMDFLRNALEDTMEEFADTLTANQKVNVLAEMLKKYIS